MEIPVGKLRVEHLAAHLKEARLLQAAEVFRRIVQAVGVVDAQPLDLPLVHQPQNQPMRLLEDVGVLHADGRQLVDVEESAIIDLVRRHAPIGQTVGLFREQLIEQVKALGLALRAVKQRHVLLDEPGDVRGSVREILEPSFEHLFFALFATITFCR